MVGDTEIAGTITMPEGMVGDIEVSGTRTEITGTIRDSRNHHQATVKG